MSGDSLILASSAIMIACLSLYFWLQGKTIEVGYQVAFGILWGTQINRAERLRRLRTNWAAYQAGSWVTPLAIGLGFLEIAQRDGSTPHVVSLYGYLLIVVGVFTLAGGLFDRRRLGRRVREGKDGFVD